ncbi:hypothetical protein GMOD_00001800 [Pyrenophora seminiperda CCB06]|uniref:Uncharacterized protein n=1 Tax=Pyrenophora seminiperda CCB06 TaxID=1302712 RepID=A0A3M7LW63_9PLEO|nr:hypothetical protein GMOD_00001800 [Pyrenophora seminiperda CCB06]
MVLYHANGRVVLVHERYLERLALEDEAAKKKCVDQRQEANKMNEQPTDNDKAKITIEGQKFETLPQDRYYIDWENLDAFSHPRVDAGSVDRTTLRFLSTTADDHFRLNPKDDELLLPVRYPYKHRRIATEVQDVQYDSQMAYIRGKEIIEIIIPWLNQAEKTVKKALASKATPSPTPKIPHIQVPDDLLGKIHLYNAMVQLGIPKFIQKPLIDALVLQMYQLPLKECHLDALEMTIGRLNARTVSVLDPVLNHFTGTYALRTPRDRMDPGSRGLRRPWDTPIPALATVVQSRERADGTALLSEDEVDFRKTKRRYLDYASVTQTRSYPQFERTELDTYILPPVLPVLGHSIRNWSGVRRDGSTVAAFTGFPLNIGTSKRLLRPPTATKTEEEDETHLLKDQGAYQNGDPGRGVPLV